MRWYLLAAKYAVPAFALLAGFGSVKFGTAGFSRGF